MKLRKVKQSFQNHDRVLFTYSTEEGENCAFQRCCSPEEVDCMDYLFVWWGIWRKKLFGFYSFILNLTGLYFIYS